MRKLILCLAFAAALPVAAQYTDVKGEKVVGNKPLAEFVRQRSELFNFGWQFRLSGDSVWRTIDLPHDFQFEQPWDQRGGSARGYKPGCEGWYRKTFVADGSWRGKLVTLDFGGLLCVGDVYLNGEKIASTDYGYVGFEADMTSRLRYGEENELTVYASTGAKKGSRWYTGSGLFRDVYLKISNPTHISRHGIFVTTPEVSADRAKVYVKVELDGWQGHEGVEVAVRLRDNDGRCVGNGSAAVRHGFDKHSRIEVALPAITVDSPKLWDLDTPNLYEAEVILKADGMVVDSLSQPFGIRTIEFSPEFGFKLNGRKVFLKGHSGHHDLGALGAAAFDKGIERMMLRLKEFGFNTIRCSHNPYSESFCRIADRVGMLVVDELIDKWSDDSYWFGRRPFTTIWPELVMEWVRRDRNSPSVIMWSLGNELQIREDWAGYKGLNDWGVTMYRIMDQVVKRFDNTRKTTVAQFPARAGAIARKDKQYQNYTMPPELACATEVASLNYQSAWYADFVRNVPGLTLFQSEAESYLWLEPYMNMDHEHSVGLAYWGAIEYWGESNRWPKKGWNYSFFDHTCHPYPQAYLLRSAFIGHEPLVRIGVLDSDGTEAINWNDVNVGQTAMHDHWNFTNGSRQQVYTFTNAHSVELLVNCKSLGCKRNDGTKNYTNVVLWKDVDYGKGGSLTAIARDADGKEVARHELQTAGKARKLVAKVETDQWAADGMDLMYIDITAVDGKGRRDILFDQPLTVTVDGNATFVALDNGDHFTSDLFHDVTTKNMRQGRMQLILRSSRQPGNVTISLSAGGMKTKMRLKTSTLNHT